MLLYGIRKKGYFFTVDALLGVSVMVLGIILVLYGFTSKPVETPQFILADDVLRVLATTTDESGASYFQSLGELVAACDFDSVSSLTEDFIEDGIIPAQFSLKLYIREGGRCNSRAPGKFQNPIRHITNRGKEITEKEAKVLISSRKIVFDTKGIFNPFIVEAHVWR